MAGPAFEIGATSNIIFGFSVVLVAVVSAGPSFSVCTNNRSPNSSLEFSLAWVGLDDGDTASSGSIRD
jgi:hypothetical protein